jgi:NCAIR mutase (PurE)-related protein
MEDPAVIRLDLARAARTGIPEAALAFGKTPEQLLQIFRAWRQRGLPGLATRVREDQARLLTAELPQLAHDPVARTLVLAVGDPPQGCAPLAGDLLVICAGTSDQPVAAEALVTARFLGASPELLADVGVAGVDRLLAHRERLAAADVLICIAGMEGALPSVVAGLARGPVIAVPTSIGYGAHLQGLAPLLAMLSSCAPGISVVNIDNGFGAAVCAAKMLQVRAAALARAGEPEGTSRGGSAEHGCAQGGDG